MALPGRPVLMPRRRHQDCMLSALAGSTCLPTSEGGFEPQQHSIPYLVTALCGRRCYLPLIRGGKPSSQRAFLLPSYTFCTLSCSSDSHAEAYLEKFKRMAEFSAAGAADEDWMASSTVLALSPPWRPRPRTPS